MLLNIFHSGGLWIIPLLMLIGAGLAGRAGYKSKQNGFYIWAAVLVICAIIALIWIGSDYKGV